MDAFVDLAEEEALHRTLVIAIDDLQWADPSSLLTLDVLHRRLAYVPICAIVCLRFAPRSRDLTRIVARLTDERGRRPSSAPGSPSTSWRRSPAAPPSTCQPTCSRPSRATTPPSPG